MSFDEGFVGSDTDVCIAVIYASYDLWQKQQAWNIHVCQNERNK